MTTTPGHQHNASMSLIYRIRPLTHWCIWVYRDISPTSQIRVEVRMRIGHSFWAKHREASEVIDLHGLFSDYWSSNNHEFTVMSQLSSPRVSSDSRAEDVVIGKHSGYLEVRFSVNDTIRTLATAHHHHPLMFAQAGALCSSLHELEGLLKEYSPLMSGSTEKSVDRA